MQPKYERCAAATSRAEWSPSADLRHHKSSSLSSRVSSRPHTCRVRPSLRPSAPRTHANHTCLNSTAQNEEMQRQREGGRARSPQGDHESEAERERECEWVREEGPLLLLLLLLLPALRSVSRVLPVAREQREERRGEGVRDGWMDHYRLMLCVLARSHSRTPGEWANQVGQAGRPGWTRGKNVLPRKTNSRRTTNERRTDGRTDGRTWTCGRTPSCVSDLVFRSLRPRPSVRVRMSV